MSSSSSISIITQGILLATALVGGISFLADLFYFLFYLVEVLGTGCQGRARVIAFVIVLVFSQEKGIMTT